MKLETLKTIESTRNDAIVAEEAKIRNWRAQIEIELRDALRNPEIGRGKEIPIRPYSNGRLDVGAAFRIIEETVNTTENDEVKHEQRKHGYGGKNHPRIDNVCYRSGTHTQRNDRYVMCACMCSKGDVAVTD